MITLTLERVYVNVLLFRNIYATGYKVSIQLLFTNIFENRLLLISKLYKQLIKRFIYKSGSFTKNSNNKCRYNHIIFYSVFYMLTRFLLYSKT